MAIRYSEEEIKGFIDECKPLPSNYRQQILPRPKRGHKERELAITGVNGSDFRLILRQSTFNAFDFSVILAVVPPKSTQLFRLKRYNGRHGEHTNSIEGITFRDCHIHIATERYQDIGMREDSFAVLTDRYSDINGAIICMLDDCNFDLPANQQASLFEDGKNDN